MPKEIYLVKVGMNMTEGIVEEWCVADGERVEKGELVYRLETEKVNLDVDAEASGVVKHIVPEGVPMKPGDVVGYIYEAGESVPDILPRAPGSAAAGLVAGPGAPTGVPRSGGARPKRVGGWRRALAIIPRRPAAVPRTERRNRGSERNRPGRPHRRGRCAGRGSRPRRHRPRRPPPRPWRGNSPRELGVDLGRVTGTGPGGRITREDVEQAASHPAAAPEFAPAGDRTIPVRAMRRTIAKRMYESLQTSAQLTMDMDVTMDDAVKTAYAVNRRVGG